MESRPDPKFAGICTKISLNLPVACTWCWDESFATVLVAFEKTDGDLVLFPLIREFDHHWDYSSLQGASGPFFDFFHSVFGVIPGQRIFTAENGAGMTLFAVWWPWGNNINISLRVGLFAADSRRTDRKQIKTLLSSWFHL